MKNVIIILCDAMRYYNLPFYGYKINTAPFLNKIKNKCLVFTNAFSCTNATDPSLASIYTGKHPIHIGLVHHGERISPLEYKSINRHIFLQEIMTRCNYLTVAIDILSRWHKRGFKYYIDPLMSRKTSPVRWLRKFTRLHDLAIKLAYTLGKSIEFTKPSATYITMLAIRLLRYISSGRKNFFLFIHYWDTHMPYKAPGHLLNNLFNKYKVFYRSKAFKSVDYILSYIRNKRWREYLQRFLELHNRDLAQVIAAYDSCILYVDMCLRNLFKELEDLGILDNTLIVITADHGESLYEHDIFLDHHGLYDVTVRVPLLFYLEDEKGSISTPFQLIDLFPTIADMCNLRTTLNLIRDLDGVPLSRLLELSDNIRPLFFEEAHTEDKIAVRVGDIKYITALNSKHAICRYCGRIHGGIEELYDLKEDPYEERNLVDERKEVKKLLRNLLLKWFSAQRSRSLIRLIK